MSIEHLKNWNSRYDQSIIFLLSLCRLLDRSIAQSLARSLTDPVTRSPWEFVSFSTILIWQKITAVSSYCFTLVIGCGFMQDIDYAGWLVETRKTHICKNLSSEFMGEWLVSWKVFAHNLSASLQIHDLQRTSWTLQGDPWHDRTVFFFHRDIYIQTRSLIARLVRTGLQLASHNTISYSRWLKDFKPDPAVSI